ncbi:ATP-binding protein [Pseudobutyrivibrio xylanivorans]|uniref:tRNA(Ile)-lysidine synthase TilS/MesJ n=1 Tax=Pseudobutyrivibrio xylanivorans DSM 14809 TaxID=1123012 RepID=A0A1M6AD31_PSEXY|nr:ATP-binding protein [Pseudobutyrivibrio xylanivorans]SHI34395.1 tRNA(Ile)-lysidine synthase TilS/MesJ [Pseudobutyrivibrio xylanivorans DSM 14809]
MKEISYKELSDLQEGSYILVDIRNEGSLKYGMIPDAVSITHELFETDLDGVMARLDKAKQVVLYCTRGQISVEDAEILCDNGFDAVSLKGGYNSYLSALMEQQDAEGEAELHAQTAEIEKSIRKKFHKTLFSPFARACKEYELIKEGDHICVCISGGKDSMLMAKLFQEIQRHQKVNFELTFLVMDPGYSAVNRQLIESNAKLMGIPIVIYESDIFDAVDTVEKNPCYLCARMRRGHLYSKAKELGCNKIALGHHYDDVIETILMGMLYGAQVQTMMPKLHSTNFEGMELIRPLYLVRQDDIIAWQRYNGLHFLQCACHFTETCDSCSVDGTSASKRLETRNLIAELKKTNPYVESNIFRSVENVNLATVIAYKQDGVKHHFLDTYDE